MSVQSAIDAFTRRRDLTADEMIEAMRTIMRGEATPAQIGGFLVGLRMKGESVIEIAAAARVMRELSTTVDAPQNHLVDTCGTGGDASNTFNVSTASAFVAAGAGAHVAKHGNRAMSGTSGSADVLEAAGVNLNLSAEKVAQCIESAGVGFMFAPNHHGAMRHAIGPRREMSIRTVFNILGPLTNPARAPNQVIGVYAKEWVLPVAQVCAELGSRHVLVVHAEDGLDEISIGAPTRVSELKDGAVQSYDISPEDFDMSRAPISSITINSPENSLAMIRGVLGGDDGPARNIVALNAGAAIYASGVATTLEQGVARANESITSGAAAESLQRLVTLSQSLSE